MHSILLRRLASILALSLLVSGSPGAATAAKSYVVVLKSEVPRDAVGAVARRIAGDPGKVYRHALRGFTVRLDAEHAAGLDALRRNAEVAYVAENRGLELHAQIPQPGMLRVRADRSGAASIDGTLDAGIDVDVAVLDTGIDPTHPDLNVYRGVSFAPGDDTPLDPNGHGTHIAGVIAAIDDGHGVHGVAPGARLWSIKVLDSTGVADLSEVLAGLDYVAEHSDEIDVANLSLGGPGLGDDGRCGAVSGDPLHQAICGVVDAGVVVVTSAGNTVPYGRDASLVSPAAFDEVITVSAVVETDGLGPGAGAGPGTIHGPDNGFARTFSNYGWDVDLAAPGVEVVSTWTGGGYSSQTGTSVAAAHVSGAAALWIAHHEKPTDRDGVLHVRNELVRLAFPQIGPDEGFSGDKERFREPLLNAGAIDPAPCDPIEPRVSTDREVYELGRDSLAAISIFLRDEQGSPLDGIPGNGFLVYLGERQLDVAVESRGQGNYGMDVDISGLLPGDHDLTVLVRDEQGFERSAGCRIVVHAPEPGLRIHDLDFTWPVMNQDWFFTSNPLFAALMDEKGAPVVLDPDSLDSSFSGDGAPLLWSFPEPDFSSGLLPGITYGAYRTQVSDVHTLPLGTYFADLSVALGAQADSGTASFDVAYHDPALTAELSANLSSFDFTQTIAPPPLSLTVDVRSEWSTGIGGLFYLVADPLTLLIDGEPAPGVTFGEDLLRPGIYTLQDLDLEALEHGTHQLRVHVSDSRGLQAYSNPLTIDVVRETHACANPLATAGQTDLDGDGYRDECDNCPAVSNRSQRNTYAGSEAEADLGDACKDFATLRVSADAGHDADFLTIQDAVDHAIASPLGVRIEILPGALPYTETVVVDRGQPLQLVGKDFGLGPPVVEHGGTARSLFELRSSGAGSIVLRNLVLRGQSHVNGQRGISAESEVSTELSDLRFESLQTALHLTAGNHRVERIEVDDSVGTGLFVEDSELSLSHAEFRGVEQAVRLTGPSSTFAEIDHVLIDGDGQGGGIANDSSGSLRVRHATLVDCDLALLGNASTTLTHAILWDNASDIVGVACGDVAWSNLQDVNCGGSNRSTDPGFVDPAAGNYRLRAGSALLDHGPDPGLFGDVPCHDLDAGPRLRDHDGDGLARVDPGAYERENTALTSRAVAGLLWSDRTTLEWAPQPSASSYRVYRAPLSALSYSSFGTCLDAGVTDPRWIDSGIPALGDGFFYEITMEDAAGVEHTLGVGSCAERSNFTACP